MVVRSYQLDVSCETDLRIKVKELLFDDAYLSKVFEDKMSWFTWMEVLDLIYHQFFFAANSLGRQRTTSQYFQPLAPQTLVLAATALHCALSEYASGKKAMVKFSQDEYQGTFGPSPVINFTLEATTQSITHQQPCHTPTPSPRRNSARRGASQSLSELLTLDWTSSISFQSQFLLSQCFSIPFRTPYPLFCAPQPGMGDFQFPLMLLQCIPHFLPTLFRRPWAGISTPQSHQCSSAWIGSPLFHSALLNLLSFGAHQCHSALLDPPSFCAPQFHSTPLNPSFFGTPPLGLDALLFDSVLLQHLLWYSSFPHNTPHLALLFSHGSCSHFSSEWIILPLIPPFRFAAS